MGRNFVGKCSETEGLEAASPPANQPTTVLCGAAGGDLAFCLEVCLQFRDDLQQTKRPEGDEQQTTSQGEAEMHSRSEVSLGLR